ncbi:MAG: pyridoxamine 5'-phosphate oxidase family protein [Shimia sp.]
MNKQTNAPWADSLADTLAEVWTRLGRATADVRSPFRNLHFATISDKGPEARIIVLRSIDRGAGQLVALTDADSGKVWQLSVDPRVAVLLWDQRASLQVRLRGTAEVLVPEDDLWGQLGPDARLNYGCMPPTGHVIDGPNAFEKTPDEAKLRRVVIAVEEIETVYLGRAGHRRALFSTVDDWRGVWLAP